MARAINRDIEQIYRDSNLGVLADVELLQQITEATRDCVKEFVRDRTGGLGRVKSGCGSAVNWHCIGCAAGSVLKQERVRQ